MKKTDLLSIYLCVAIGWLLDVLSTYVGLTLGLYESSQLFLLFPFMWMIMFCSLAILIYYFKWAPVIVRKILLIGIIFGSFAPSLHNLRLIFMVIL